MSTVPLSILIAMMNSAYISLILLLLISDGVGKTKNDLLRKSMGWFVYDNGLRHERVNYTQ